MESLAWECTRKEGLHIASDFVILEVIRDGEPVSPHEPGDVVVTGLLNYAMPLIRYEVGDYGQVSETDCSCGLPYPLLDNVVGRVSDVFLTADGRKINTHSLILHLIDEGPKVGQVQLVQKTIREILVRLTDDPYPDVSVKEFYENSLKELITGLEKVSFEIVNKLESEKSGKYRFAICEVDQKSDSMAEPNDISEK